MVASLSLSLERATIISKISNNSTVSNNYYAMTLALQITMIVHVGVCTSKSDAKQGRNRNKYFRGTSNWQQVLLRSVNSTLLLSRSNGQWLLHDRRTHCTGWTSLGEYSSLQACRNRSPVSSESSTDVRTSLTILRCAFQCPMLLVARTFDLRCRHQLRVGRWSNFLDPTRPDPKLT